MNAKIRRVLITGGGSGIGLAMARTFRESGHEVTVAGRNEQRLKATGLPSVVMDVADPESVAAAMARCGPVDVFIANAGGAETSPIVKTKRDLWDRMIALNLTSVYLCAQRAVPQMIERGWGRFIVIASTAALRGYAYAGAYGAAKHGALGLVRALALELANTGVTANAICPGYTDTPLIADAVKTIADKTGRSPADAATTFTRANPMSRLVSPHEVAAAALWLAGDAAASVNGQAIAVDGGETA